jgi:hypothetical protein
MIAIAHDANHSLLTTSVINRLCMWQYWRIMIVWRCLLPIYYLLMMVPDGYGGMVMIIARGVQNLN